MMMMPDARMARMMTDPRYRRLLAAAEEDVASFFAALQECRRSGAFFVFLSPHVKNKHGHEVCGISPDRSMLVVTPAIDVSTALTDLPEDPRHGGESELFSQCGIVAAN